jgi:hypothetical protein
MFPTQVRNRTVNYFVLLWCHFLNFSSAPTICLIHACMQGNCSSEPFQDLRLSKTDVLASRKPGQCVLIADGRLLLAKHSLWLHNLYVHHSSATVVDDPSVLSCLGSACNLWLTSVTLQGDPHQVTYFGGVAVFGGQLYAKGADLLCSVLSKHYCH